jgi:hypothetical protein
MQEDKKPNNLILRYDIPIEVTQEQYKHLNVKYAGAIAHREFQGKFYIKIWDMRYEKIIAQYLFQKKV